MKKIYKVHTVEEKFGKKNSQENDENKENDIKTEKISYNT